MEKFKKAERALPEDVNTEQARIPTLPMNRCHAGASEWTPRLSLISAVAPRMTLRTDDSWRQDFGRRKEAQESRFLYGSLGSKAAQTSMDVAGSGHAEYREHGSKEAKTSQGGQRVGKSGKRDLSKGCKSIGRSRKVRRVEESVGVSAACVSSEQDMHGCNNVVDCSLAIFGSEMQLGDTKSAKPLTRKTEYFDMTVLDPDSAQSGDTKAAKPLTRNTEYFDISAVDLDGSSMIPELAKNIFDISTTDSADEDVA